MASNEQNKIYELRFTGWSCPIFHYLYLRLKVFLKLMTLASAEMPTTR